VHVGFLPTAAGLQLTRRSAAAAAVTLPGAEI
jgi:hypothetical protein